MALETGVTYIEDLEATNPVGATDNVDEGDDHIRNIKTAVQGSFPNLGNAGVTRTAAEINDLITTDSTDTLTNKTLTSPIINEILDANGNESLTIASVSSAVNNIRVANAVTGANPVLKSQGEADAGIDYEDSNNAVVFRMETVASAVNFIKALAAATGNAATIEAAGTDTNININIVPKGSGVTNVADIVISASFSATGLIDEADHVAITAGDSYVHQAVEPELEWSDSSSSTVLADFNNTGHFIVQRAGTYRCFFQSKVNIGSADARVYANDIAVGTVVTFNDTSYTSHQRDITFAAGDVVQIKVAPSGSLATLKNWRIRATIKPFG